MDIVWCRYCVCWQFYIVTIRYWIHIVRKPVTYNLWRRLCILFRRFLFFFLVLLFNISSSSAYHLRIFMEFMWNWTMWTMMCSVKKCCTHNCFFFHEKCHCIRWKTIPIDDATKHQNNATSFNFGLNLLRVLVDDLRVEKIISKMNNPSFFSKVLTSKRKNSKKNVCFFFFIWKINLFSTDCIFECPFQMVIIPIGFICVQNVH